jgi:hypothetical protein
MVGACRKNGRQCNAEEPKRVIKGKLYSRRRRGISRKRCLDDVDSDLKIMKVKNGKKR